MTASPQPISGVITNNGVSNTSFVVDNVIEDQKKEGKQKR
jgi:hypothetical protein